ncbi:molybdopterin adenylyltransferase [Breoghania sp.]|uniref:molybdopterin adenylyltransferase n=1 Tax=Breoghania sp. TaxID=2065378 RepID=UPI00262D5FE3|nr:molybdopterin adenylyltransferase [Breoghania sp.]MDJ0929728.1 molybdopterin adenylyltransferase [Breoghania sp.]
MKIVVVTISDRASRGEYEDISGPAIVEWLERAITSPCEIERVVIPDGEIVVRDELIRLADAEHVDMVLTTGGTGPSPRDQTPEAMKAVLQKELPGFGELLRKVGLEQTPTSILSRQTAGTRGTTFYLNLPGKPAAIAMSLDAVFPAISYCLDLIGAGRIETDPAVVVSFRSKS